MKTINKVLSLSFVLLLLLVQYANAQYVTTKIKTKHQVYTDSLKNIEYNYLLPILGQGA